MVYEYSRVERLETVTTLNLGRLDLRLYGNWAIDYDNALNGGVMALLGVYIQNREDFEHELSDGCGFSTKDLYDLIRSSSGWLYRG
jgi:hypothetical protein